MKRAFTLIELLVVIGIIGMMATVSIGGYAALTRGMSERGALEAARGIADIACQRAQIDRGKTYIYLFNEVTRIDSDEDVGVACGVAIAVRPIGRITRKDGSYFYDEFGDLNQSYDSTESEASEENESAKENASATVRLYNITQKSIATVREGVHLDATSQAIDLEEGDEGVGVYIKTYGFEGVGGASFSVGDEYGQEFSVMRLPPGYVFSSSVNMASQSDLGMKQVGSVIEIDATGTKNPSAPTLTIYSRRPDGSFVQVKDN